MIRTDVVFRGMQRHGSALDTDQWRGSGAFAWIVLCEPTADELARVYAATGVPPDIEDHLGHRPALAVVGDNVVLGLKIAKYLPEPVDLDVTGVVLLFGKDYLVTISETAQSDLGSLTDSDVADGPLAAFHATLDALIDSYQAVIEAINQVVSEVELQVFADERGQNPGRRVYRLRRVVAKLEQFTTPLADEPLERLVRRVMPSWIAEDGHGPGSGLAALVQIDRHFRRLVGRVQGLRDLLDSILNANLTQVSVRQNEDMRKISAWVAIAAVPTMIAGIYGMNFQHMPELSWTLGYPAAGALMATICAVLYWRFRRNDWL